MTTKQKEFRKYLVSVLACPESIYWARNKTARQAWAQCQKPEWLTFWLLKSGIRIDSAFKRAKIPYWSSSLRPFYTLSIAVNFRTHRENLAICRKIRAHFKMPTKGLSQ